MNNPNIPQFEFDTTIFKEYLKSKLTALFEQMPGKKTLIVDPKVTPLLNLTIDVPSLNNAGINQILEVQNVETFDKETTQILIMIPPKMDVTKRVAQIIRQHEGIGPQRQYLLVFWPQRTILCKELLDQEGVMSSVELRDFTFDLIPLDLDVLSLEMPDSFRDMIVDYDLSIYNYVAESINRLQLVMGNIPNVYCKGEGAKMVYDILKLETGEINPESTEIESLMIFDRSLDLFTPMLTQLVYEGLVDEFFNIDGNLLKVEKKILGKEGAGGDEKTIIQFSSERDPLIYQVRNLLLAPLGGYLQEQTQQQERDKEEFQREKSKNLNDKLVQHAKRIKAEQESVSKHINISTKITQYFRTVEFYKRLNLEQGIINGEKQEKTLDYIEALIQVGADLNKVMRLLCLRSIYDGGLKQKTYDYFRKEIIQVYGFKTIQFINNLQRAGMFVRNDGNKSVWPKLQEQLKLLDVDIKSTDPNPKDCAYTYSGHCPLIARLAELIFKKPFSWKGNKSMQLIPGFQYEPEKPVKNVPQQDGRKPIVIIYILGGVTFGEISAFRLLGKLFCKDIKFINFREGNHCVHYKCDEWDEIHRLSKRTYLSFFFYIFLRKLLISAFMISDQSFFSEKIWIPKQAISKLFDGNLFIKSKKKDFWKSRFFELYQDKLKIFKNGRDKQECSTILLGNVYLDLHSDEKFPITLIQDGKKLVLHARCQESRDKWIKYLKQTCILNVYRETYVNLKVLGKGTFAKVLLAERKEDKKQFAVKTFMKSQDKYKLSLLNEISVLRICDHPNIIKLYEIHESQEYIYMIMELLEGGELYETIIKNGSFQEKIIAKIMFKIFDALEYLHKKVHLNQIMHRDLKPENIVLKDQDYDVKLVDFGLAAFLNSESSSKRCGTPGYVAPEILEDQKYDEKVDIFSAGVILYVLLSGTSPFYAENLEDILEKNRQCNIDFQIKGISKEAKELLQLTLAIDPKLRISATQALNHKFITQYYSRQCETMEDEEPIIDEQHNDNFSAFENMKKFQSESYKLNKAKPSLIQQTPLMGKRNQIQNDSWLQEKSPIIQIQQQQSPPKDKETLTIFTTSHSRKSSNAQKSNQEIEKKKASMVRNYLKKMDI